MTTTDFKWTPAREKTAIYLAEGYSYKDAAALAGIHEQTVYKWMAHSIFRTVVDKLTFVVGASLRAERIRMAKRMLRKKGFDSNKDPIDILEYIEKQSEGIDIQELEEAYDSVLLVNGDSTEEGSEGFLSKEWQVLTKPVAALPEGRDEPG